MNYLNEEKKDLKRGDSYIFKKRWENPLKGRVSDITKTTIQIEWESGNKIRYDMEYMHDNYVIQEELETPSIYPEVEQMPF